MHQTAPPRTRTGTGYAWFGAYTALLLAAVGLAGSLYLSLGMGLKACPLCFYQRSFVMGVFAILAVGLAVDRSQAGLYTLLSVPLGLAGLGVAAFHEYLVQANVLECPPGILAIGAAPAQSLTLFVLLSAAVFVGGLSGRVEGTRWTIGLVGGVVLGLLLAWSSIASSPPLPPAPSAPYDPIEQPLEMCRPPYQAEQS